MVAADSMICRSERGRRSPSAARDWDASQSFRRASGSLAALGGDKGVGSARWLQADWHRQRRPETHLEDYSEGFRCLSGTTNC